MAAAKKSGLLAILGGGSDGPSPMGSEEDAPEADGKTEAAQSLLDAIDGGDAESVASAFQALYDQCAATGAPDDMMDA
jgi:hypothetical protein